MLRQRGADAATVDFWGRRLDPARLHFAPFTAAAYAAGDGLPLHFLGDDEGDDPGSGPGGPPERGEDGGGGAEDFRRADPEALAALAGHDWAASYRADYARARADLEAKACLEFLIPVEAQPAYKARDEAICGRLRVLLDGAGDLPGGGAGGRTAGRPERAREAGTAGGGLRPDPPLFQRGPPDHLLPASTRPPPGATSWTARGPCATIPSCCPGSWPPRSSGGGAGAGLLAGGGGAAGAQAGPAQQPPPDLGQEGRGAGALVPAEGAVGEGEALPGPGHGDVEDAPLLGIGRGREGAPSAVAPGRSVPVSALPGPALRGPRGKRPASQPGT